MKRIAFYVIVAAQALFLIGMSAAYYAIDAVGESIKLRTEPIDPRDLFYGDYVTLNYEIEQIPIEKWNVEKEASYGDMIHVLLERREDGIYEVVEASNRMYDPGDNQVAVQAKYEWSSEVEKIHRVSYGINRYYVEENTGRELEEQAGEMIVEVAIAPWGQKKIVSIDNE
ncbi:GDYXXLXY domain-containing protein [Thalassobacillus hwangdonensis]|uniref:GDYXXLXY domain-containing protein n=1 Tax=Thalassobacillus hwangdonensis TaxID=546108 RepID=A0ABW3KYG6_9BACI